MSRPLLLMLGGLLLAWPVLAADWPQAAADARREAEALVQEQTRTLAELRAQRQALAAELAAVRAELAAKEAALKRRQQELEQLQQTTRRQETELTDDQQELATLEAAVRQTARDAGRLLAASPTALDRPEELTLLRQLAEGTTAVNFAGVERLAAALAREAAENGRPLRRETAFAAADGALAQGEVLSFGPFLSLAETGGRVQWLVPDLELGRLRTAAARPGWWQQRQLSSWWHGDGEALTLDLSRGEVLRQPAAADGLRSLVRAGGLLVWPILLIGVVAVMLVLERLLVLWRLRANADALTREARQALDAGRLEECRSICRRYRRNPAAAVLAAGLAHAGQGAEALENAFREAILRQMPKLERFLPTLSVLGAVAPLLGLLGTVTGMIATFRALTAHGSGQPGLLSGGISEALITTQLGLAVAIPVLLLHHFLERRVERLADEMEATAVAFTSPLLRSEPGE